MANLKRVEKRLDTVEGWLKECWRTTGCTKN